MITRRLLALPLLLLAGCGGSDDPAALAEAGSLAFHSGDYEGAVESYESALAQLQSTDPDWKRVKIGLIQARAKLDAPRAKEEFLQFASANPSQVTDSDYNLVASRLGEAGGLNEAIAVLEAGKAAFPESPHLDALGETLVKRAKDSNDSGALDALKGLGYL